MISPYVVTANALAQIIAVTFAPERIKAEHDNLHESLGYDGPRCGIAPVSEVPMARNQVVQDTTVLVKLYDRWNKEIDNETSVDPRKIAAWGERLRRGVEAYAIEGPEGDVTWYMTVTRIDYPDDPTGNKTRLVATVVAKGRNSGLVETTL